MWGIRGGASGRAEGRAGRAGRAAVAPSPRWGRPGPGAPLPSWGGAGLGARSARRPSSGLGRPRPKAARGFLLFPRTPVLCRPSLRLLLGNGVCAPRESPPRGAPPSSAVGAFVRVRARGAACLPAPRRSCRHRYEGEQHRSRRDVPRVVGVASRFLMLPCVSSPGILDKGLSDTVHVRGQIAKQLLLFWSPVPPHQQTMFFPPAVECTLYVGTCWRGHHAKNLQCGCSQLGVLSRFGRSQLDGEQVFFQFEGLGTSLSLAPLDIRS